MTQIPKMEQGRQIVFLVSLAVVSALLSVSETRSIASLEVSQKNFIVSSILFCEAVAEVFISIISQRRILVNERSSTLGVQCM